MANITTSSPVFYSNGTSGASSVVGYEGRRVRVVRYSFTTPLEGATKISISIGYASKQDGSASSPYVHISTSSAYPSGIPSSVTKHGEISINGSTATANIEYAFLPNTTYYVWIYPRDASTYGYWYWSTAAATITTSGSTAAVTPTINVKGTAIIGGGKLEITARPLVRGYKCKLTYRVGVYPVNTDSEETDYDSYSKDMSLDNLWIISAFQKAAANSSSAKFTVTCTTYNVSGNSIGSKSASVTLNMPTSGNYYENYFKPTASLTAESITDNATVKGWEGSGCYVAGYSKIKLSPTYSKNANDEGAASLKSYSLSCGSSNIWNGKSFLNSYKCVLNSTGKVAPTLSITDSRGNSASNNASTYNVEPYFKPSLRLVSKGRCHSDSSGLVAGDVSYTPAANGDKAYMKLDSVSFASVKGNNACTARVLCNGAEIDHFEINSSISEYEYVVEIDDGLNLNEQYIIDIVLTDSLGNTASIKDVIPKRTVGLHLMKGGLGAAVGKYSEEKGIFDIGFKTRFYGGIQPKVLNSSDSIDDRTDPNIYTGNKSAYNGDFVLEVLPVGAEEGNVFQRIHYYDTNGRLISAERYRTSDGAWTAWLGVLLNDGFYDYIMHPNGSAECWRTETAPSEVNITVVDKVWYRSEYVVLKDFPSVEKYAGKGTEPLFASDKNLCVDVSFTSKSSNDDGLGAFVWHYAEKSSTKPGNVGLYRFSKASGLNGELNIYAKGRWF